MTDIEDDRMGRGLEKELGNELGNSKEEAIGITTKGTWSSPHVVTMTSTFPHKTGMKSWVTGPFLLCLEQGYSVTTSTPKAGVSPKGSVL
jgi:hypothetical protein